MKKQILIQKLIASVLLLLFLFSITPKLFLHDCIAKHKDGKTTIAFANGSEQISTAGYNCQCDNLVVESPFVQIIDGVVFKAAISFSIYNQSVYNFSFSSSHYSATLRGPPAFA